MIKYINTIRLLSVPAQSSHYTPNSRNGKCCETPTPPPRPLCPFPGRNSWRHRIHCLKPNINKQFYSPSHMPWPLITSMGPKLLEDGWVEDSWLNNFSRSSSSPICLTYTEFSLPKDEGAQQSQPEGFDGFPLALWHSLVRDTLSILSTECSLFIFNLIFRDKVSL